MLSFFYVVFLLVRIFQLLLATALIVILHVFVIHFQALGFQFLVIVEVLVQVGDVLFELLDVLGIFFFFLHLFLNFEFHSLLTKI